MVGLMRVDMSVKPPMTMGRTRLNGLVVDNVGRCMLNGLARSVMLLRLWV